ncbi:hypothetical protein SDC9_99401 [bioreactor metagenome]|uniref:DUF5683 domain-containing protein n=1 Tax=bioreactor metagenome TaxID=1076179 RepID=A0A645AK22_9ZZZZ
MNRIAATIILFFAFFNIVVAQNIDDTSVVVHSPKKATIMSACLPGLGQAYNRKYWKIPVIYSGLGGTGYSILWNNNKYQTFRKAYIARTDTLDSTTDNFPRYSAANLLDLRNYYRHNLELSVIIFSAIYVLNIVDASVDAHLYDFDISDDLSLSVQPSLWNAGSFISPSIGGGFTLTFKLKP